MLLNDTNIIYITEHIDTLFPTVGLLIVTSANGSGQTSE